ncbi:hypothetical protein Oweho_1361 [Owenweeksia hongkongensis DSM 17368]|uniref:Lipocalin-like domain-containing protein n=1 Tax=Owenweeksia hongkongensis (strain DSM 17368 / CIP 108786 / JCM 12287 / NRRL B-23963 / UST20020801) TaxID=926562 RepID=G8R7K5_OWEHD|nr:DUF6252 family protein [Owenweeksia hongkongensis]AEV32358.1 hypothetical protein Oweho_1361 [Owenweeksia hongkongensis DSM 17368]
MKILKSTVLACAIAFASCSKDDKEDDQTSQPSAKAGEITYTLDGLTISGTGGGYNWEDTTYFVKHEDGLKQLSIYINGNTEGTYSVGSHTFERNKGFFAYYPDNQTAYEATSGEVKLSKIDGKKVTGTFSGTLTNSKDGSTMKLENGGFNAVTVSSW